MKGLVWHGGQDLSLDEVPDPIATGDEAVLAVELAGICGSDLHGYRGHPGPRVPPLILGHEAVGTVDGERYTVYPLIGCGACARCAAGEDNLCDAWRLLGMHRAGVFAEQVVVPRRSLVPLPTEVDAHHAVLTEPLACCLGALSPHAVRPDTRLLVLGCGPIGLLTVFAAARLGGEVLAVDVVKERRAQAGRLGAARAAASAEELPDGRVDLVVDAAGFEGTWRAGIDAVRAGGAVVVVGLGHAEGTVPMAQLVRRGVMLRGQFGYTRGEFAEALAILAGSELDLDWITESCLDDGAVAFANLVARPDQYSKVLLRP
jgi:threonine dehydrogenase-like Zn-dependent dehydrogenase